MGATSSIPSYVVWLITASAVASLIKLAIVWLSLRGAKPSERPAILRTLPPILSACKRDWGAITRMPKIRRTERARRRLEASGKPATSNLRDSQPD